MKMTSDPIAESDAHAGLSGSTPQTSVARRLCSDLLRDIVLDLGAESATVLAPSGNGQLVPVAHAGGRNPPSSDSDDRAYRVATDVLRSKQPVVVAVGSEGSGEELLGIPCKLDDEVSAVVTARRVMRVRSPSVALESTSLLSLALAVDRYRVQLTLEESLGEAEAIRRQLDAYAVDLRSTYLAERDRSQELADALEVLTKTYESTVRGLAIAVEAKDEYTGGHLYRVSRYGMAITAIVAPEHTDDPQFEYGFLLHDVGKLVVPDAILMKTGPLDDFEWSLMRGHPEAGKTILDEIPFLTDANEIVHSHHERWDGKGYPRGLTGEEIPLGARIFPLADVFDAMTTTRPYRKALSVAEARNELQAGSGTQFWPDAVEAFSMIPVEELELVRASVRPDAPA
jgi:HD-GYP domain-containing protein (c-di-GMP phosphodiesterase class II)